MAYKILIKPSAVKDLDNLIDTDIMKISVRLNQLKENPRPVGIQKLTDKDGYRIRVGNYRILFEINEKLKTIFIYRIKHRKDVYKK